MFIEIYKTNLDIKSFTALRLFIQIEFKIFLSNKHMFDDIVGESTTVKI